MWKLLLFDAGAPLFLFPWTVSVLLLENRDMKYMSVVYGLLVSCVILGRYIGNIYTFEKKGGQGNVKPEARIQCGMLFFSFAVLSVTTRLMLLFICYFIVGFASASLSTLIQNHKNYLLRRYRQKSGGLTVRHEILRMNIFSLVCCTLLSGLFFDANTDSLLPAFAPCALVAIYFLILMVKDVISDWKKHPLCARFSGGRVMESVDGAMSGSGAIHNAVSADAMELDIDEASVVPSDLYVKAFNNDMAAAKTAYITRLKWRKMYDVDNIFDHPQNFFDEVLENYPHAIHGRSKEGCVVVYELIGQGNPRELTAIGITPDSLLWHFNLRNEYIFRRLSKITAGPIADCPAEDAVTNLMTVIDVKGIGMSDFTADVLSFMKKSSDTIESYSPPGTVVRLVIVNAPYWFSSVWGMIAKVLPESVNKKVITIKNMSELDKFIDPSQRPELYGGTDPNPLGQSPDHLGFMELPKAWATSPTDALNIDISALKGSSSVISPLPSPLPTHSGKSLSVGRPPLLTSSSSMDLSTVSPSPVAASPAPKKEGWFSRFGKSKSQKEAYLGDSNSYRFDKNTQSWVLDDNLSTCKGSEKETLEKKGQAFGGKGAAGNEKSGGKGAVENYTSKDSGKSDYNSKSFNPSADLINHRRETRARTGSLDQLEEHGLILAIQAAHKARTTGGQGAESENNNDGDVEMGSPALPRKDISSSLTEGTASVVGKIQGLGVYNRKDSVGDDGADGGVEADEGGNGNNRTGRSSLTSTVMRISGPLFLYVFSAHAAACFCQSCSIWLLPLWVYSPADHGGLNYSVLDFSMVLSSTGLLLWAIHIYGLERLQLVISSSPARAIRIGCGSMAFAIFFMPVLARATTIGVFLSAQPSTAPTALIIPSTLIAILITGSYVTRMATVTILSTSLKNSFAMPDTVITAISGVMDVIAPCVGSVLFSFFYREHHFGLPLQSFVVMYGIIIILSVLYSSTLLLNVHFRGDFGIVTERLIDIQDSSRRNRWLQCFSGDTYVPIRGRESEGTYYILKGYALALAQAAVNCLLDAIAVPHGDIQFLVSPGAAVASHGGLINSSRPGGFSSRNYKNV